MDAKFLNHIKSDYPCLRFVHGRRFAFRPPKTIIIGPKEPSDKLLLLHEVGHAISGHKSFKTDVKRLKMEAEAWEKARMLASKYKIKFNEDLAQKELDTYRDWLHQKSRCPKCGLTRFETSNGQYRCPRCEFFS